MLSFSPTEQCRDRVQALGTTSVPLGAWKDLGLSFLLCNWPASLTRQALGHVEA